jgi:hypothetical protein
MRYKLRGVCKERGKLASEHSTVALWEIDKIPRDHGKIESKRFLPAGASVN